MVRQGLMQTQIIHAWILGSMHLRNSIYLCNHPDGAPSSALKVTKFLKNIDNNQVVYYNIFNEAFQHI